MYLALYLTYNIVCYCIHLEYRLHVLIVHFP